MKKIGFIVFILSNLFLSGQNLVPNPSFEIYTACPSGDFQIELATPWFSPNATTLAQKASYFNTCATNSIFAIPYFDGTDYRQPHTGNAFGGNLWSYTPGNNNLRKYITTSLTNSLVTNNYYYISFYASTFLRGFKYAINNLGAYVSAGVPYNSNPNAVLNYTPQIIKYGNPIINDTINWIKIDGIYLANGNENYITIGNFMDDINTDTAFIGSGFYGASNYYIDDVSVINISTPQWQYRDTSVVIGDSVLIGPAISGLNVNWFTMSNAFIKNAPGIYVKPTTTTSYQATETFNSVVYNHTVTVTVLITKTNEYDKLQNSIMLFPNPTPNNFTISNLAESSQLKVDITDTHGNLYSTELITPTNNKATIKTNLTNGVYFVSITDTVSGLKTIKKLIVQK
ncbi:MAG: T9SS type A sorting domain-containing protein [Bacteroidia bacterium]|nr:T9SS type A sorting domain-containing protein [Bacteroidia bacterium]